MVGSSDITIFWQQIPIHKSKRLTIELCYTAVVNDITSAYAITSV